MSNKPTDVSEESREDQPGSKVNTVTEEVRAAT